MCTKPPSLIELSQTYDTEEKCLRLLESLRWADGPTCPRCESSTAYKIKNRRVFECGDCRHQYSATSGTIMHRSRLPLPKWILAAALIVNGRKGISACQMARESKGSGIKGVRIKGVRNLYW